MDDDWGLAPEIAFGLQSFLSLADVPSLHATLDVFCSALVLYLLDDYPAKTLLRVESTMPWQTNPSLQCQSGP